MSTTAEIEARRTAVAIVRSAVDGDRRAGRMLRSSVEDARELRRALEGLARGLAVVNPAVPRAPATFDGLVAYIGRHVQYMARADGVTTRSILDRLALAALGA